MHSILKTRRFGLALAVASLLCALPSEVFGAEPLGLEQAVQVAVARSRQLAGIDSAVTSSRDMAVAARQLPDPVIKVGVDNLPVSGADKLSLSSDFMTMRRVGVMQEFTRSD